MWFNDVPTCHTYLNKDLTSSAKAMNAGSKCPIWGRDIAAWTDGWALLGPGPSNNRGGGWKGRNEGLGMVRFDMTRNVPDSLSQKDRLFSFGVTLNQSLKEITRSLVWFFPSPIVRPSRSIVGQREFALVAAHFFAISTFINPFVLRGWYLKDPKTLSTDG